MSTRRNGLFPCVSCTSCASPPDPTTHHREFLQQKHNVTEPLATIGNHFTAKTYPVLRTALNSQRGGRKAKEP